jgi:6-phospho-beta-glucosidase
MTKLCIIGGGGVRMPFVAKSIALKASRLGINEIVFFDNSEEKMKIYGDLARRIAIKISPGLDIALSTNARDSLRNADYIICAVRPGGDLSRVNDEKVVAKYNLLAQETTGACGFSMAMRSIPTLLE